MENTICENIIMDLAKNRSNAVVYCRQNDVYSREIHFIFNVRGKPFGLGNLVFAEIHIEKPDGSHVDNAMVRIGNQLAYTIRTQDTSVTGECEATIRMTFKDGSMISTSFGIIVAKGIEYDSQESENVNNALTQMVAEAARYAQQAEEIVGEARDKFGWAKLEGSELKLYTDKSMQTLIQTVILPAGGAGGEADGNTRYTFSQSGQTITITDTDGGRQYINLPNASGETYTFSLSGNVLTIRDSKGQQQNLTLPDGSSDIVATGNDAVTNKTKLQVTSSGQEYELLTREDLESNNRNLVGYAEVRNGYLYLYSDNTKQYLINSVALPAGGSGGSGETYDHSAIETAIRGITKAPSTSVTSNDDTSLATAGAVNRAVSGKYVKPSSGIPKTDLASDVQTSVNRADQLTDDYIRNLGGGVKAFYIDEDDLYEYKYSPWEGNITASENKVTTKHVYDLARDMKNDVILIGNAGEEIYRQTIMSTEYEDVVFLTINGVMVSTIKISSSYEISRNTYYVLTNLSRTDVVSDRYSGYVPTARAVANYVEEHAGKDNVKVLDYNEAGSDHITSAVMDYDESFVQMFGYDGIQGLKLAFQGVDQGKFIWSAIVGSYIYWATYDTNTNTWDREKTEMGAADVTYDKVSRILFSSPDFQERISDSFLIIDEGNVHKASVDDVKRTILGGINIKNAAVSTTSLISSCDDFFVNDEGLMYRMPKETVKTTLGIDDLVERVTNLEGNNTTGSEAAGGYQKPLGGIPYSDLSSSVQASLDKADRVFENDYNNVTLYFYDNGKLYSNSSKIVESSKSLIVNKINESAANQMFAIVVEYEGETRYLYLSGKTSSKCVFSDIVDGKLKIELTASKVELITSYIVPNARDMVTALDNLLKKLAYTDQSVLRTEYQAWKDAMEIDW